MKCLYCYLPIDGAEIDFHTHCATKMFGTSVLPVIDVDLKKIEELAQQIVIKSVALTGVQPKLSLSMERHKNQLSRLTIVGMQGDYILKPPSTTYAELPENEDLTMHMAAAINITVAKHCLVRLNTGAIAYLTKRFDRKKGGKIAVEDFCQLSESLTEHKYRGSVEKIGKLTHQFTANKGYEAQRLFELVVFCYMAGNADMHLKNYSLIENEIGEYSLSPAYDLLNTELVISDDKEESALTINGKKNRLKRSDFDTLARSLKINEKAIAYIYNRFDKALPKWEELIKQSFLSKEMQVKYTELLSLRHRKLFGY